MERDYSAMEDRLREIADDKMTSGFVFDTCIMAASTIDTLSRENQKLNSEYEQLAKLVCVADDGAAERARQLEAENERLSKSADAYKEAAEIFQRKAYDEQKQREALEVENQQIKQRLDAKETPGLLICRTHNGINVNENVWVKPTERGWKILKACDYVTYKEQNGFAKIQLWQFMHALGHGFIMGLPNAIEDNMIYFEEPEGWNK